MPSSVTMRGLVLAAIELCAVLLTTNSEEVKTLGYNYDNDGSGLYRYSFKTSDGTYRQEESAIKSPNTDDESLVIKGSYGYLGDDGKMYEVTYIADETGFHPQGAHLHIPPYSPNQPPSPHSTAEAATKSFVNEDVSQSLEENYANPRKYVAQNQAVNTLNNAVSVYGLSESPRRSHVEEENAQVLKNTVGFSGAAENSNSNEDIDIMQLLRKLNLDGIDVENLLQVIGENGSTNIRIQEINDM